MTPEVLGYRSALEILKVVSANEGGWTWYNITVRVDQVDGVEKNPPVFHVLKLLVRSGFLRTEPTGGGNAAVYHLTDEGKQALATLVSSAGGNG